MRWTLISAAVALVLVIFGIYVTGPENTNIVQKAIYWFVVVGFLTTQGVHLLVKIRKHNL